MDPQQPDGGADAGSRLSSAPSSPLGFPEPARPALSLVEAQTVAPAADLQAPPVAPAMPVPLAAVPADEEQSAHDRDGVRTQILCRELNERAMRTEDSASFNTIICECRDRDCDEQLSITYEEYEYVRTRGSDFVVAHGHERPGVELRVEAVDRFAVVRTVGDDRAIAEGLNPRKRQRSVGP